MSTRGAAEMEAPEMEAGTEPLRALFERQYRPMVRLAELLLADRASAEDVTQEAFARLYVRFDRLWDREAAGAYLRVMVVNLARSALRRRLVALRYLQREPSREPSVGDVAGATADHEAAISALRHLPRRQRECLVLRYYLDQPEAEIATTLGISSGSVKTHTSRGLATMAKLLGGEAA